MSILVFKLRGHGDFIRVNCVATAVSYNTNGGNLVWFGNQERGTRVLRGNGLARCFSLFLFGDYSK